MRTYHAIAEATIATLFTLLVAGCGGERRPIEMGPVDTGPGTLASARQFLEGRWHLESFEIHSPGKPPLVLKGTGTLTYDAMSNLRMEVRADAASADMLRAAGIDQRGVFERGEGYYAVAECTIKYRKSARLEDELMVLSGVREVRAASCIIHQRVMRGLELLTDATVTAAFLTADGRPQRQPREWVEKFERLKGA